MTKAQSCFEFAPNNFINLAHVVGFEITGASVRVLLATIGPLGAPEILVEDPNRVRAFLDLMEPPRKPRRAVPPGATRLSELQKKKGSDGGVGR